MSTFEDAPSSKLNKSWVKAGTFNAGNRKEDTSEKGKLYKPTSKLLENVGDQLDKKYTNPSKVGDADEKVSNPLYIYYAPILPEGIGGINCAGGSLFIVKTC